MRAKHVISLGDNMLINLINNQYISNYKLQKLASKSKFNNIPLAPFQWPDHRIILVFLFFQWDRVPGNKSQRKHLKLGI